MYSKFLFVGLGGSGGKTLRFLKREILTWMAGHDAGTKIPQGWQFLHIDTPTIPDGDEINHLADHLQPDEYLGLIRDGMTFHALQNVLDGQSSLWPEMQTWRVEPSGLGVGIALGAGQKRAIGQTIAMAYARQIRDKLQTTTARLKVGRADTEIGELYNKVTKKQPDTNTLTYIVVISSLAGGTGAGLLTTTCDILRNLDTPAGDSIFAILYTPEVFRSLKGAVGGGVQANSLAAISEVLNGQWWHGSVTSAPGMVPPIESAVLKQAGLPEPMERSGPTYPFLVGLVGASGIDHGTPDQLFQLTGRSLLSWVCDEVIQAKFIAYTAGNWANSANSMPQGPILVNEGAPHETGAPCFSALGFSRLSVGTSYLEKYALQRLVRDALDHLLNYHHDSPAAAEVKKQKDTNNPKVLLDTMAVNHLPRFLRDVQLTEMGPTENEILDALRPPGVEDIQMRLLHRALELSEVDTPQQLGIEEWRELIRDGLNAALVEFENEYQHQLETSTREWISHIQYRICQAVEKWTASHGWLVTGQLCNLTARYLKDTVRRDLLENNLSQCRTYVEWRFRYVDEQLEGMRGKIDNDHLQLRDAVDAGANGAYYAGEAQLIERASTLVLELALRVVEPLEAALKAAYEQGRRDARKTVAWVEWENPAPPVALKPPAGDFSLINADDYPTLFDDLTRRDTSTGKAELDTPRTLARQDIVSGNFLKEITSKVSERDDLGCVRVTSGWWPSSSAAIAGAQGASNLDVHIATSLPELEDRARRWLNRHGSAWGTYLNQGMRSFVSASRASAQDLHARQTALLTQLSAALAAAAPLINIDTALMGLVHPNASEQPRLHISQIPMAGHPMESQLRSRLNSHGIDDDELRGTFTNDDRIRHVDITSSLAAPHSVLAIESLLRPIGEQWAKVAGTQDARNFWLHRRSQPIRRFVPAPQATICCMIRGWFTGRLLGHIKHDGLEVSVVSDTHGIHQFPQHLLSAPRSQHDTLAQILESLALAYVEVSRAGNVRPLRPYIELRDLGRSGPGSPLYRYEHLSPALSAWIESGRFPHAITKPFLQSDEQADSWSSSQSDSWADDDPRQERLTRLSQLLHKTIDGYQKLYDNHKERTKASRTVISDAPLWIGLWEPLMLHALKDLVRAADKHGDTLTSGELM